MLIGADPNGGGWASATERIPTFWAFAFLWIWGPLFTHRLLYNLQTKLQPLRDHSINRSFFSPPHQHFFSFKYPSSLSYLGGPSSRSHNEVPRITLWKGKGGRLYRLTLIAGQKYLTLITGNTLLYIVKKTITMNSHFVRKILYSEFVFNWWYLMSKASMFM